MMQFHSWQQFWQMGGYGAYVWSAYGLVLTCFIGKPIAIWWQSKKIKSKLL